MSGQQNTLRRKKKEEICSFVLRLYVSAKKKPRGFSTKLHPLPSVRCHIVIRRSSALQNNNTGTFIYIYLYIGDVVGIRTRPVYLTSANTRIAIAICHCICNHIAICNLFFSFWSFSVLDPLWVKVPTVQTGLILLLWWFFIITSEVRPTRHSVYRLLLLLLGPLLASNC